MASDTANALERAKVLFGANGTQVLSTPGHAVHTKATIKSRESDIKLAADYAAFALADVHLALGQSSLSSNAAQMGLGTIRRTGWDNVCRLVREEELESLRGTL